MIALINSMLMRDHLVKEIKMELSTYLRDQFYCCQMITLLGLLPGLESEAPTSGLRLVSCGLTRM